MKIYVASRASIPERAEMWRNFDETYDITSTWIYEDGAGQTEDYTELWGRIEREIRAADKLVLYATNGDFPLKGALIEVGIAIGIGKPVIVCLPQVSLDGITSRPVGSWIKHPLVRRIDNITAAMDAAV